MKIYYIDDEIYLCEIFEELLSDEDTAVLTFIDPQEAIRQGRVDPPDLIFLDYRFTNTTGDQVAKHFNPETPKVLITGELELDHCGMFVKSIAKPFKLEEIKRVVESFRK